MAADAEKSALLEKAQLLHDAQNMHDTQKGADASGNGTGSPGAAAVGVADGPTPAAEQDWVDKLPERIKNASLHLPGPFGLIATLRDTAPVKAAQDIVGRGLGYIGGATRTAAAQAVGMVTPGENPVGMGDWLDVAAGHAPGVGDYAERFGVPNKTFQIPGTNNKTVGTKDALNVVGNAVLDPLTYEGARNWMGRRLYNNAIRPVEVEGNRFGKNEVGDELYKNGVSNPLNLRQKVQAIVDKNMETARGLEKNGAAGGGQVDMNKAMAPAQSFVDDLAAKAIDPEDLSLVKRLQRSIDAHRKLGARPSQQILRELPYTEEQWETKYKPNPEVSVYDAPTESTGQLMQNEVINRNDAKGRPIVNVKPLAKKPGNIVINNEADQISSLPQQGDYELAPKMVPKTATVLDETEPTLGPSPVQGAQMKSAAYKKAGNNAYDQLRRSEVYQQFKKLQGAGLKAETENAIGQGAGAEAQKIYADTNESTGKMLSTGKAQERVGNQAQRDLDMATGAPGGGTEGVVTAVTGATHGGKAALTAAAIQRAMRLIKLSQMPVGYGLRSVPQGVALPSILENNFNQYGGKSEQER